MNLPRIFLSCLLTFQIGLASTQQFRALPLDETESYQVESIVRDSIGFLWIATDSGLNRYDGERLEQYPHTISSGPIHDLIKTSQGKILFSSDEGIYEIKNFPDTAIVVLLFPSRSQITDSTLYLPNNIFAEENGTLWVSEPSGSVVRVDGETIQRFELGILNTADKANGSFSFVKDEAGNLWAASQSGYVFRYNETQGKFIEMLDSDRLGTINQLISMGDGRILLLGDRIYRGRINQNGFLDNVITLVNLPGEINDAARGPFGKMYFGTNRGLYRASYPADFKDFEQVLVHNDPHRVEELPFEVIKQVNYSKGDLWLSTTQGGYLLKTNFFESIESLPMQGIYSVAQVQPNDIYASFGELYRITKTPTGTTTKPVLGNDHGFILGVEGRGDSIWASNVQGELLFLLRGKIRRKFNLGKRGGAIFYLYLDRLKNLWICQAPTSKPIPGVARLNTKNKLSYYGPEKGLDQRILVVKQGPDGRLLAAGIGEGSYLFQYHQQSDSFINLSLPLPFDNARFEVHDIAIDDQGAIWLGSTDGLLRYDSQGIERVYLGEFTDVEIRGVAIGGDGSVWASTDVRGLLRYHDSNVVAFDQAAGLPSQISNYRTLIKGADDRIWIGTAEGLAPTQFPNPKPGKTPTPFFTKIKANDEPVDHTKAGQFKDPLKLDFRYTSLSFPSSGIQFLTRLVLPDNPSPEWLSQDDKNIQIFPRLALGEFVYQVRARRPGGYQWSDPVSYRFSVSEASNQTYWTYGGIGLVGLLLIWSFSRISTLKLRKKLFKLQNMLNEGKTTIGNGSKTDTNHLKSLSKLLERLNKTTGWPGKTSMIFEELRKNLPVDSFGIGLIDQSSGEIQAQDILDLQGQLQRRTITISGTQNFPFECTSTSKMICLKDMDQAKAEVTRKLEFQEDKLMNTLVYLPLKVSNKTIGYISIKSQSNQAFDPPDLQTFKVLASIIAMSKSG